MGCEALLPSLLNLPRGITSRAAETTAYFVCLLRRGKKVQKDGGQKNIPN